MAEILLARGGTPDFKGWFCEGDWAQYQPPYDAPHMPNTPPFDSHADAAYGQGWLNLHFPLVPMLAETTAHVWMQNAMKRELKARNDVLLLNWVPLRSYVDSIYFEVTKTDKNLDGVYIKPVAYRCAWDFTTEEWVFTPVTAFDNEMTAANITQFPLGTPVGGDKMYGIAKLGFNGANPPSTFGHNIVQKDQTGKPVAGADQYFGAVLLGVQVVDGDDAKIKEMWRGLYAFYLSAKLLTFEGASQVG